jgi:endonuclease/exonuclease/phosphatase (EEP) superfamily protein YafD
MLAPVLPAADFTNHFRPYIFAAAVALLAATVVVGAPWAMWPSAVLVAVNVLLLALPLLWSAEQAERPAQAHAAGGRDLKVLTFNMDFVDPAPVAELLLAEDADVVLLQEVGPKEMDALRPLLAARYPHIHACERRFNCNAAIFAKRAWTEVGQRARSSATPETIWAQFDHPETGRLRVVGVHASQPRRPRLQVGQVEGLIALRGTLTGSVVFAGDFNMTPWSYPLQTLLASADLRRHATFLRSWPAIRRHRLPLPLFLIDHVVTTPDIRTVSIETGPNLGSTHRPVIAHLRLP